jgi:hypothetical protein
MEVVQDHGEDTMDGAEDDDEHCPGDLVLGKGFGDRSDNFHLAFQSVTSAAQRLTGQCSMGSIGQQLANGGR